MYFEISDISQSSAVGFGYIMKKKEKVLTTIDRYVKMWFREFNEMKATNRFVPSIKFKGEIFLNFLAMI